jgi:hypothetical protein
LTDCSRRSWGCGLSNGFGSCCCPAPVAADNRHDRDDRPILARDVDNPANERWKFSPALSSGNTFTVCPADRNTFTVPLPTNSSQPVKRYVIEYVSGTCQTAPGEAIIRVVCGHSIGGVCSLIRSSVTFNSTLKTTIPWLSRPDSMPTPDRLCRSELAESVLSGQTIPPPCNSVAIRLSGETPRCGLEHRSLCRP